MKEKCLLIVTKDGRRFLTHQKNLPYIIEFVKTFSAEVYVVRTENNKVLELKALANAICDQEYNDNPDCTITKKVWPKNTRKNMIESASKIRSFIRSQLLTGESISLKDIKQKYKNLEITDACLCNHFSTIRRELIRDGHKLVKIGSGKYSLS